MEKGGSASPARQGGRVIHPVYAKHAIKDAKGGSEIPINIIGERRLNVCTHPSAVNSRSLSVRYTNKNCKTLTNMDRHLFHHRQKYPSEFSPEEISDPKVMSVRAKQNSGNRTYSGPVTIYDEQPSTSTAKDHITEKNKKSSVEPKRFYQRKFSAFSGIKLPVGRFFKLLRPDLQRRNSCPVISLPELQLSDKLNSTLQSKLETGLEPNLIPNGDINSQKNLKCRLTKWTSHSELLHFETKRQNIACDLPYNKNKTVLNRQSNTVTPPPVSTKPNGLNYSKAESAPSSKSLEISVESDCLRNSAAGPHKTSLEKSPNNPTEQGSFGKTVIIVSKSSGIPNGSNENNFVKGRSSTSCYISNIETPMPSMNNEFTQLQTQNSDISGIECNSSENESGVIIDQIKVINTLAFKNDQRIRDSHNPKQNLRTLPTSQSSELGTSNIVEYGENGLNTVEIFNQQRNINDCTSDNINLEIDRLDYSNLEKDYKCSLKTAQVKENTHKELSNSDSDEKIRGLIVIQNENLNTKQTISLHTTSDESRDNSKRVLLNVRAQNNNTSVLNIQSNSYKSVERNQEKFNSQPIYAVIKKDLNNGNDRDICDYYHEVKHVDSSKATQARSECGTNRTVAYIGSNNAVESADKYRNESIHVDINNQLNCNTNDGITLNISESQNEVDPPESINITHNEMGSKKLSGVELKENPSQKNSEVDSACQPDSLNFGECSSNTSLTDLQNRHITECYNVKLDAPEEVIVAGFHDFCQTTLSLEESIESQDTATVKRKTKGKDKKMYSTAELNGKKSPTNAQDSELNNMQGHLEIKSIKPGYDLVEKRKSLTNTEGNNSDKLLEEIQNSKLLGKMNIKDPDVIEAIRALDKSLMEISEEFPETDIDNSLISELGQSSEGIKGKPISNIAAKVIREDKIQCDNLIEELMLEDISKRVENDSQRSIERGIAVTISNNNVQQNSEIDVQNSETDSYTSSNQNLQNSENHDYWLSKKMGNSLKVSNTMSDVSSSNFEELSSDTGCSDICEPQEIKKFNVASDVDNGPFTDPTTLESGNNSVVYPLQVSVDHSQGALQVEATSNRTSPCSVDSGTSSHNQSFFVVVAIDFGTTYSGYAFSFTRDPDNIHMMKKWDGGDPGVFNQKTPTTLLLSPEGTFHSFGYSARDYYHDLDEEEAKEWLYFEKFKMALHHSECLSLETKIAAANGKCTSAVTVFAHALRYFKEHALQELTDQSSTKILNEDVRWVVTVPAIWKQPAKQFMRAAAYKAGIASPDYPEQLLIALEPEAASIYCRRIRLHQLVPDETHFQRSSFQWQKDKDTESEAGSTKSDKDFGSYSLCGQGYEDSFTTGTRYMVVDCGGGTVDITVHELLDKQGALKELQKASGGPYGSIGVDIEFEKLLCEIFGEDFMQQFKAKRPIGFLDLMVAFEARKRNANPYKNNSLNISLPFSFVDFYKSHTGSSVETAMKNSSHKNVKWSAQGMLRLEPSAMESLFRKTVENIRKHIENIINQKDMNIEHIFLVGGFAESLILQKEIKDSFSSTQKVIIPQGVSLAILKGAVLFGLDPTTINIRRLRMTYGVGVLNRFIHGVHPREKLVVKDGIQWCADVFDKFVVNEQSVDVGDVVLRRYTPAKDGQSCSVIHIYCSEKDNAYFITDNGVKRCATLILDLSESRFVKGREIQTQMMFGDTEIKVSALDVTTGKCVKAEVDFLNQ